MKEATKVRYRQSALTVTQERMLLADAEKIWPREYERNRSEKASEPANVTKARAVVRAWEDKLAAARGDRYREASDRYADCRRAIIFAETKEAAIKAVDNFRAWRKKAGYPT